MNFKIRTAVPSDLQQIMIIEEAGFIPQIQEKREVFEKRISLCPQLFLIFEDSLSHKTAGYLCAELMDKIPQSPEEIALGHEPINVSSVPNWRNNEFLHKQNSSPVHSFDEQNCGNVSSVPNWRKNASLNEQDSEVFLYISSFSILPEFRGKGNGEKLWKESLDFLTMENLPLSLTGGIMNSCTNRTARQFTVLENKTVENFPLSLIGGELDSCTNKRNSPIHSFDKQNCGIFPLSLTGGKMSSCTNTESRQFTVLKNKTVENFPLSPIGGFLLLVNETWDAAKHIYEKSGFQEIKVFKDFFKTENGTFSNGILMKKSFNESREN